MASTWEVAGYCLCPLLPPTCGPEARPPHYPSGLELWLLPSTSGLQLHSGLSEPQTPQPGLRGQGLCPSDSSSRGERSRPGNHSPVSRWSLFTPQGWELRQKTGGSWEGLQEEGGSIIPGGVGFLGGHSLSILEEVQGLWLSPKPETREWTLGPLHQSPSPCQRPHSGYICLPVSSLPAPSFPLPPPGFRLP